MTDVFPRRHAAAVFVGAAALALFAPVVAHAQLRVATWNISNYGDTTQTGTGNRSAALKTAIYGTFENRSMAPDVFMTQEFLSDPASSNFLTVLNTAPNSPGDWARASFVNGNDTDSAFFYRTSKVNFVADVTVVTGADGAAPPRDVHRYDVTLKGYSATVAPALSLYSVHMKAGDSGSGPSGDEGRRETEANAIRANAASLPAGRQFLVGGDFNTPGSSDAGYARLVESRANDAGRWTFTPDKPIPEGDNMLRLDQVMAEGKVQLRIEVPFDRATPLDVTRAEGSIVVQPGNNLWSIARRLYGEGYHYTMIFGLNKEQIKDPDLIYPEQQFTLPKQAPGSDS